MLPLVERLVSDPSADDAAQRMAANAATFAAAHFSEGAVLAHWQRIIDRYAALYRGAADPAAAQARREAAERVGQEASRAGAEAEQQCAQTGGEDCPRAAFDAARVVVDAARQAGTSGGGGGPAALRR